MEAPYLSSPLNIKLKSHAVIYKELKPHAEIQID